MKRFLIGQLASFGDCLYATTVAKQIKMDYPGSHITWAVASRYKSILDLNPDIDEIWEIPLINNDYYDLGWTKFETEARKRKDDGIYDELVFTQLAKQHWKRYDGTIRSSTLKGYKSSITVAVDPVIRLGEDEVKRVADFSKKANLDSFKHVILCEYAPTSGQSFISKAFVLQVAQHITSTRKDVCFVLSGPEHLPGSNTQIIDASELTFRENAELTKYCTLLVGGSSGITWLSTSDWAKKLKMVQLLNKDFQFFAGVKYDLEYWGIPTNGIIEITNNSIEHAINCIYAILDQSFESAKTVFDEIYRPDYLNFKNVLVIVMRMYDNRIGPVMSLVKGYHRRNKHLKLRALLYYSFKEIIKVYKPKLILVLKRYIPKINAK